MQVGSEEKFSLKSREIFARMVRNLDKERARDGGGGREVVLEDTNERLKEYVVREQELAAKERERGLRSEKLSAG